MWKDFIQIESAGKVQQNNKRKLEMQIKVLSFQPFIVPLKFTKSNRNYYSLTEKPMKALS